MSDRITASVRSCRTSRARPAPRARRMPISRCRASPRASITLATLAHAISMTSAKATATGRKSARVSASMGMRLATESSVAAVERTESGCAAVERRIQLDSASVATPAPAPSFRRTTSRRKPTGERPRSPDIRSSALMGAQKSGFTAPRPSNPASVTPTISIGTLWIRSVCPTMDGSAPKRVRQTWWLSTRTLADPGASSSSVSTLPMAARPPRTSK